MNNNKGKKIFFILYVILACADFLYSIFNLIRHFFYTEFSLSMLFSSLGMRILYLLPLIAFIILSIQTVLNIIIALAMHDNMSGVSGEQAMGAAFVALILIVFKVFLDLILLPAIPLSIAGIIKCNSKKEIEQDRKNRLLGKKINIVCLVIAVAELVLIW